MTDNKAINLKYIIAVGFMLFFILNDLLFDFAFSFKASDLIAFGFTILSAIIVFVCTGKIKNDEFKKHYYKTTSFIKSNFDNAQVIFSLLDILCGLISICSSVFFLSYSFKIVKIIYIPVKVLVVLNKEKSLLKPITKFSYLWTSMRLFEKNGGFMKNFFKANKMTLALGTPLSVLCGFLAFVAMNVYFKLPLYVNIITAVVAVGVSFACIFYLGKDTIESLALRFAKKTLNEEQYAKIIDIYTKAVGDIEKTKAKEELNKRIEAEAEKRLKAEAKAKEAVVDNSAKEEFERLVNERIAQKRQGN